jgi:uncharacterized membrane protein YoaT (DUF817 family)
MRLRRFALQLWRFAWLEARACVFAGAIFFGLAVSAVVPLPINRGDALFVYGAVMTVLFWWFGSESGRDVALVTSFHLLGLGFELVKVSIGSWSYPDTGLLAIGGVPLYSGFLYAAVGSYVCRAWRLLRLRLTGYRVWTTALISLAIYVNFLASGWLFDVRLALTALLVYVTLGAWVHFSVGGVEYRMPVVVSFLLIAVFLWVAENLGTFLGTWVYPHQAEGWELVHLTKLWAWALLVTVCFTPVATWMQWTVPDRHALRRAAEARIASRKR